MPPKIPACIKIAAMIAAVVAVCWVAGCAKKSGPEAVPETRDTLTVISDTLSKTYDTLSETPDTLSKIPNTLTDKRDGKTYKTVTIGKQVWMAENLNYKPESGKFWCYMDNCAKYAGSAKYGRLYDWATAMGGVSSSSLNPNGVQGVCPSGWHLPSRAEWDQLAVAVGGTRIFNRKSSIYYDWYHAGKYLKSQTGWRSYNGIENLDNYGFSALPGGGRYRTVGFGNAGDYGHWWTATEDSDGFAYCRSMAYYFDDFGEYDHEKATGYSVRCVRDKSAAGASSQKSVGDDSVRIEMVFVKGGTFMMGCTNERGSDRYDWEKPAHSVTVSDFYIDKYEVTQNQWVQVMGSSNNPSHFKGGNLPVEQVSWKDAQKFILRLNTMTGKKYRLPTEAEWEYAARGGASGKGYKYSGGDNVNDTAWHNVNSGSRYESVE